MARRSAFAFAFAFALLALVRDASAQPYGPAKPVDPPLPPGSAADPTESLEQASPSRPVETYPPARDASPGSLSPDAKRARPEYGGPPAEPHSAAWWIPRTLLSPLFVVTEYGIRLPFGALVNHAERHQWPQKFLYYSSFGTFGTEHEILVLPTVDFEWGVRLNGGLALSWKNALVHGNAINASATAGGPDWLLSRFGDRLALGRESSLALVAEAGRRGDLRFHGIGPSSPSAGHLFNYAHAFAELEYENHFWRSSVLETASGIRAAGFDDDRAERRFVVLPPGFDGYTLSYNRMRAAIDTRAPRHPEASERLSDFVSPPGTGVRVEGRAEHDVELSRGDDMRPRREWVRYGGGVGTYLDVTGRQRTVGVALATELVSPLGDGSPDAVPFTELATLGGLEPLRAFRMYRLLDRSYLAAKASYRWPVWASLDGALDATFGNVFGAAYEGFAPRLLRGSFTVGLETTAARDQAFQLLVGVGTRTFSDGFGVDSLRVVAGTSRHF